MSNSLHIDTVWKGNHKGQSLLHPPKNHQQFFRLN